MAAAGAELSDSPASAGPALVQKSLRLNNGLQVTLVSDPAAGTAAAAVVVRAGLLQDPPDRPGAAHLLEHMVLSSPAGASASVLDYVRARRGDANARTGGPTTEYYLSVPPVHLAAALARLAHQLARPRFTLPALERELAAVDAEFAARSRSPLRRELAVHRRSVNPAHRWARAFGGNRASLGPAGTSLAESLERYFRQHYGPERMSLAVVAPLPLDVLERQVTAPFSALSPRPAREIPAPELMPSPRSPWLTEIRSAQSLVLSFWFAVQARRVCEGRDAHSYLESLITARGPGSLTHAIRSRGWIRHQDYSRVEIGHDTALISLRFLLSAAGGQHREEIGELLFQYLKLMSRGADEPTRLAQWNAATALRQRYSASRSASDQARAAAHQALAASHCEPVEAEDVADALADYAADNVFVSHIHPQAPAEQRARHYPVRYRQTPLAAPVLARWRHPKAESALALPPLSPYNPGESTEPVPVAPQAPMRVAYGRRLELWHGRPESLTAPRVWLQFQLASTVAVESARDALHLEILAAAFDAALEPVVELGKAFGYRADAHATASGLSLRVSGFSGAFERFAGAVLTALTDLTISQAQFQQIAERVAGRHTRFLHGSKPLDVLETELRQVVERPAASHRRLQRAARQLDYHEFVHWQRRFSTSVAGRALVLGHLPRDRAVALAEPMRRLLQHGTGQSAPPPGTEPEQALTGSGMRRLALRHPDVAVAHYLRAPDASLRTHAAMALLGPLLNQYMKRALRDQEQLAYLVAVKPAHFGEMPGAVLSVQSPRTTEQALLQAMRTHLRRFESRLAAMPDSVFARFRVASLERLSRPPETLEALGRREWRNITSHSYDSDPRGRMLDIVRRLSRQEVLSVYRIILAALEHDPLVLVAPGGRPPG